MRRALRFSDLTRRAKEDREEALRQDDAGEPRVICDYCDQPIVPGEVGFAIQQFEVVVSNKSGRDVYQDIHMEDGSSEKCYHFTCLAEHITQPCIIGAEHEM